jgi:hypothetical protein
MVLKDDSPLHRLPPSYPVPVVQMLDGIRYAIAMADLSYSRLRQTLATAFQEPETRPNPFRIASAARNVSTRMRQLVVHFTVDSPRSLPA